MIHMKKHERVEDQPRDTKRIKKDSGERAEKTEETKESTNTRQHSPVGGEQQHRQQQTSTSIVPVSTQNPVDPNAVLALSNILSFRAEREAAVAFLLDQARPNVGRSRSDMSRTAHAHPSPNEPALDQLYRMSVLGRSQPSGMIDPRFSAVSGLSLGPVAMQVGSGNAAAGNVMPGAVHLDNISLASMAQQPHAASAAPNSVSVSRSDQRISAQSQYSQHPQQHRPYQHTAAVAGGAGTASLPLGLPRGAYNAGVGAGAGTGTGEHPAAAASRRNSGGILISLALSSDRESLTDYQCLIRDQIYLFEARPEDIECNAQGRNRPIVLGQVGILCRHCAGLPPGHRSRGAVYFPARLQGLYQAAQNMAINHFADSCPAMPEEIRGRLVTLKEQKSSVIGGGKNYWANGARVLGVAESDHGLLFKTPPHSGGSRGPGAGGL